MHTQKKFQIFFSALLVLALLAGALPARQARAAGSTWYVNPGGQPLSSCNGSTNDTYLEAQAGDTLPNCAFSDISVALDAAANGDIIYMENTDTYTWINQATSPYVINKSLHIIIGDNIELQTSNSSASFFEISANNVRISAEHINGATLWVRTSDKTGIVVDSGLTNIIIDGLQFVGESAGSIGVDFKGPITDLQVVDNAFWTFSFTGGAALKFADVPAGVVDIKGNYFGYSPDGAVQLPAANSLDLSYNSWSLRNSPQTIDTTALHGATATHTTYMLPYINKSVFLAGDRTDEGFGNPSVTYGDTLTVTVGADVKELNGAQFDFIFDPTVLEFTTAVTDNSDFTAASLSSLVDTSAASTGKLTFHGLTKGIKPGSTSLDKEEAVFFQAVFSILPINDSTSTKLYISRFGAGFTMDPGYGPSNSILSQGADVAVIGYEPGNKSNGHTYQEILPGKGTVTGTVSMQGRIARDGVAVKLWQSGSTVRSTTTIDKISDNYTFANLYNGAYQLTFTKKGYLDLNLDLNKTKYFTSGGTVAALELKGGDANDDNEITIDDGTLIGRDYGTIGVDTSGQFTDINSDGTVNIFDLALMGGNYDLTSTPVDNTNVYSTWTPQ
jgi:hypothetical protein